MKEMKQHCYLINVWFTWLGLPLLALAMGIYQKWWAGALVLIAGIFAQVGYVRIFPRISSLLGYGSVENEAPASQPQVAGISTVTLYTANVCPFCPIVRKRLTELQQQMGFVLEEVDVTFRPELVKSKGFRSVPVVEAGGRYWVGNATTAQLALFLSTPTNSPHPLSSSLKTKEEERG